MAASASADPAWFYSSLSQVTAALVGFFGAALILRLQRNRERWRDGRRALEKGLKRYNDLRPDDKWEGQAATISNLVDNGFRTHLPRELPIFAGFLIALLIVGVAWPLRDLPAPEMGAKEPQIVWVGAITILALLYLFGSARAALAKYHDLCDEAKRTIEKPPGEPSEPSRDLHYVWRLIQRLGVFLGFE
jgi:hypothetical protein